MTRYQRPGNGVPLNVAPQLACWDAVDSPGQVRLAAFLAHLESAVAPLISGVDGPLAVELIVGLAPEVPLTSGGRDLDNYLYPVTQRLGAHRLAAVFGRKVHGSSRLAAGPAQPETPTISAGFTIRMSGSYERAQWKATLRERLLQARVSPVPRGPVAMDIAITTGPARTWPNLWKPLLDAFGPVLGEDPAQAFHPHDDRITSLGLHHNIAADLGHDVIIEAWWSTTSPPP